METQNEASMPVEYSEEWSVTIGKENYILDEKQIQVLKQADLNGHRGIIWFDKFAISIPHIQAIYRISKRIKNQLASGERQNYDQTPEERESSRKVYRRARQDLIKKGVLKP